MRRTLAALIALIALGPPGAAVAQQRFGTVTAVGVPKGQAVRTAALGDVDGDGRDDLIVSTRKGGRRGGRTLRVHLRRDGEAAFAPEADAALDLYDDVTAFAVGDVDPEKGAEVLLFTANAVHAWRTRAPEERRIVRLLDASFLFQLPDPKEAFAFESAVQDVDGDGLDDLVVPEPGGYRIALQRRAEGASQFGAPSLLVVPDDAAGEVTETASTRKMRAKAARKQLRVALQFGSTPETPRDLLAVEESVPAPHLIDYDADGRRDLLAQTPHQLHVWRQRADRTFAAAPDVSLDLPFAADRTRRFDVSYAAQTADVDGDRRADCVLFAGDKRSSEVRTQVLLYGQGGGRTLFGGEGLPDQVLAIAGFAGAARLVDVDGDGRLDLAAGSMRVDALDAVAAAARGTLDAELYVFRNQGTKFSREPDLVVPLAVQADALRREGAIVARFVSDLTGDGVAELLVREDPTRVKLYLLRKTRDGLQRPAQPLFETSVPADARVVVRERPGRPAEVLLVEDTQVRHVRFP